MGDGMQSLDRDGDEIDRLARLLVDAWVRAEGSVPNVSYIATFVDMARAIHRDNREKHGAITWGTTCLNCASLLDRNFTDYVRAERATERVRYLEDMIEDLQQFAVNKLYTDYPDFYESIMWITEAE